VRAFVGLTCLRTGISDRQNFLTRRETNIFSILDLLHGASDLIDLSHIVFFCICFCFVSFYLIPVLFLFLLIRAICGNLYTMFTRMLIVRS
jgi:hypothetical protein